MTMDQIEDNIVKNEGVYVGTPIEAEDVCQVVLKQTKLLDKEEVSLSKNQLIRSLKILSSFWKLHHSELKSLLTSSPNI
jgi:hypothetical protein